MRTLQTLRAREASIMWYTPRLMVLIMLPSLLSLNPMLLMLCVPFLAMHVFCGLTEVFEDYVHSVAVRKLCLLAVAVLLLKVVKICVLSAVFPLAF